MTYLWSFSDLFAKEFSGLPQSDQDKILDFTDIYEEYGLEEFSVYEGKIAPSWSGGADAEALRYARSNHLWHYHVGVPEYRQFHTAYKTSDWLLHFTWPHRGSHILLVDLYSHYTSAGDFYLPPESYLSITE